MNRLEYCATILLGNSINYPLSNGGVVQQTRPQAQAAQAYHQGRQIVGASPLHAQPDHCLCGLPRHLVDARLLVLGYGSPDLIDDLGGVQLLEDAVAAQQDEVLVAAQLVLADLGLRADAVGDAPKLGELGLDVADGSGH